MIALAAVAGYLVGTIPTAAGLGRMWGIDLRSEGSGNPGANNALRVGGPALAAVVLLVEIGKGAAAVIVGLALAGDTGAALAGVAGVTGNVYNVWYRLEGGKGLGMTAGVLAALWPTALIPAIAIIALGALITRSAGSAAIIAIVGLNVMAVAWHFFGWPTGWGISQTELLMLVSAALGMILWWKHWRDSSFSGRRRQLRPESV